MNKREMAAECRKWIDHFWRDESGPTAVRVKEVLNASAAALEREAEAEEKAKPKVTLEQQIAAVESSRDYCHSSGIECACGSLPTCPRMDAAADTLRRLRDEGWKVLGKYHTSEPCPATDLLRSLGVEPKP